MMRMKLVAAAAVVAALATPAMAMGPHARSEAVQRRNHEARMHYHHYRQRGFWPGEVAGGIVGGALGAAGALASAPFGYDPYYDGYYGQPSPYAW
jgi:hypothetical protein